MLTLEAWANMSQSLTSYFSECLGSNESRLKNVYLGVGDIA